MRAEFFNQQIERLKLRFSAKAFDPESTRIIGREVAAMNEEAFMRLVDFLITSRPHTKPPLLSDFRDAKVRLEKNSFQRDVQGAAQAMNRDAGSWSGGLSSFLNKNYPGAKNILEAVSIERLKIQVRKANGEE